MNDSSDCCNPTPIKDCRLPDQSSGVGYQTPRQVKTFDMIEKRYGKLVEDPDSMKPTPFKRGIPGQEG